MWSRGVCVCVCVRVCGIDCNGSIKIHTTTRRRHKEGRRRGAGRRRKKRTLLLLGGVFLITPTTLYDYDGFAGLFFILIPVKSTSQVISQVESPSKAYHHGVVESSSRQVVKSSRRSSLKRPFIHYSSSIHIPTLYDTRLLLAYCLLNSQFPVKNKQRTAYSFASG